jgi:hypothetical protein
LTILENEKRALNSFRRNNVRVHLRGIETQLLNGINPYKLLSNEDKHILELASKYDVKHTHSSALND